MDVNATALSAAMTPKKKLSLAQSFFDSAEFVEAREMSWQAMPSGVGAQDFGFQGEVYLLNAKIENFECRPSLAQSFAACAVGAFTVADLPMSRSLALCEQSYANSLLALNDDAMACAQEAVDFAQARFDARALVNGLTYLGIVGLWAGKLKDSVEALEAAQNFCREFSLGAAEVHPALVRCLGEYMKLHLNSLSLTRMGVHHDKREAQSMLALAQSGMAIHAKVTPGTLSKPLQQTLSVGFNGCAALALVYSEDERAALPFMTRCQISLKDAPANSWLHCFPSLIRAEQARLALNSRKAQAHAQTALEYAQRAGHVPLQMFLSRLLLACQPPASPDSSR